MAFLINMGNDTRDKIREIAAYAALFLGAALFVRLFGAPTLGALLVIIASVYIVLRRPEYGLWLTVAAMFFPADFERALGFTFQVTPTRLFGGLLVFAVFLNYRKYDWSRLTRGAGVFLWAVALLLWGAVTLLANDSSTIGSYIGEVLPSVIIMMMIILVVETKEMVGRLLMVITAAALITAISGLLQVRSGSLDRIAGLAKNPNALAYNCMLGFCLGLALWRRAGSRLSRAAWFGALLLFVVTLFFTASRSAILGFAVILLVLAAWSIKNKQLRLLSVFALIALILMFVAPEIFWLRIGNLPLPGSPVVSSTAREVTTREWMYPRGWQLFLQSPIYGWGAFRFAKVNGSIQAWSMHSWYLAMLCEQGIIGLFLYACLFLSVAANFRGVSKLEGSDDYLREETQFLTIGAIGLAVTGIFNTGPLDKVVFTIAGISLVLCTIPRNGPRHTDKPPCAG